MKEKKLIPKRRFKEFENDEAWEKRKLGGVAKVGIGYPFSSNEFDDSGKYLVITNGNIQDDLPFVDSSIGNRINLINDALNEYTLSPNDILVTMDGTVGRTAKVVEQNQILAQRVGRLSTDLNSEFLYQSLGTGKFFRDMTLLSHGGTIKHISLEQIGNYILYMPVSNKEQEEIGTFFTSLDNLITLHQHKLKKLENLKKAYLNEMFV